MNSEPLFKRFDELADTPERIPALRKVILAYLLHSAVNSPDAITRAGALREAHEFRRRALIKNASRKEVPAVPDVTDEDLPPGLYDIPTVLFDRLGNIASIEKGLSQIQSTTPGKYPLVVTAETRSSSESFDFEGAAAIIPLVSSTGHGDASLKRLHYQEGRYAVGNILAVVKPICPDLLRARFIYEYLSAFKEELLVSRMVGTANVSLTVNKLKELPVPLVSGPVLSRIDELMALCDRLEAQQQERETRHTALARASLARFADAPTPANLQFLFHSSYNITPADLRKSILTLAVQGKLVPQDPNDELAEDVLARIATTKLRLQKTGQIGKEKIVEPLQPESLPFESPESWRWAKLAELTELITKGSSPKWQGIAYVSESEGILFITSENVGNYVLRKLDDLKYVSKGFNDIEPRSILKRGDILMNLVGASIGRTAVYVLHDGANINQAVALIRLVRETDGVDPRFLLHYLNSPNAIGYMLSSRVVNAQPNISLTDAREFAVPIPPLAEQRRIVAKVEQLMALVDALETQLAASRATAANLLSALVAELTSAKASVKGSAVKISANTEAAEDSDEFVEALVIAQLTRGLSKPKFPLGRMRYNKLAYLAHRLAGEDVTKHYIKKAAGPYSPWAKFDGPEDIAIEKGFVRRGEHGEYKGLLTGDSIGEIDRHLAAYPICQAVDQILSTFDRVPKEELELLATVDFAAVDLRTAGKPITAEGVEEVIATNKEWAPKLDRQIFSQPNLKRALARLEAMFPRFYKESV